MNETKKYTIVYPECVTRGYIRVYFPKYEHVETDNLKGVLADKFGSNVYFVFNGWVEETKD